MIEFLIMSSKKTQFGKCKWQCVPRVGENIIIEGKLFEVTNVIHNIDAIQSKDDYTIVVLVKEV